MWWKIVFLQRCIAEIEDEYTFYLLFPLYLELIFEVTLLSTETWLIVSLV